MDETKLETKLEPKQATAVANPTSNRKPLSLSRTIRNFKRFANDLLPPIVSKLFQKRQGSKRQATDKITEAGDNENQMSKPVEFLIPAKSPNEIWSDFDQTEVTMLPRHLRNHLWAMPENELLVLGTICKLLDPKSVFEFGTFTGGSTLAIAANSSPDAKIITLDIPPADRRTHRTGVGSDIPFDYEIGESFLGTQFESKIESVQCETSLFDATPYLGKMDLIFVDADHTYSFATSDTKNAMQMLAPGGVILWHDYRWDDDAPECEGVTRCVNEFHHANQNCKEILGTRFAIYQDQRLHNVGEHNVGERNDSTQDIAKAAA